MAIAGSSKGRTEAFEAFNLGSNPSPAAKTGTHVTVPSTFTPSKRLKLLNPELTVRSFIFPSQHARTPHALTSGYNFNYHNISKSNYPALMFFKSLKNEILLFTLGLTILTIIITAALGAFSTQTAGRDAEKATSDTLQSQTKESLIQIAESTAKQQDILFEQLKS